MADGDRTERTFWNGYTACVEAAGVPPEKAFWYLRWARDFALSMKKVPLRERTREQVGAYLLGLRERRSLKSWQVAQARVALEILYRDHLHISMDLPGFTGVFQEGEADGTIRKNFTGPPEKGSAVHDALLEQAGKAMRRHRCAGVAVKSALHWISRFLLFSRAADPAVLGTGHVVRYLDHLREKGMGGKDRRTEALDALLFFFTAVLGRLPGESPPPAAKVHRPPP
jgi:hypothetical protein